MNRTDVYEFVFRGLLTEEALDSAGRSRPVLSPLSDEDISKALSIDLLDPQFVVPARQMAVVYTAIAAFENSVRALVKNVLIEAMGEEWWTISVSSHVRTRSEKRQADEAANRWHTQRGDEPLSYTEFKDLANTIRNNWEHFEAFLPSAEWAASIIDNIERSRNVIMHSGMLDPEDIARVGIHLRDWVTQVGT